ncbi:MAG: hypothetical protein LC808_29410 [Actinobacteria bacterium]|nr:hypothetical protein [Actinomycetota bacterium]
MDVACPAGWQPGRTGLLDADSPAFDHGRGRDRGTLHESLPSRIRSA